MVTASTAANAAVNNDIILMVNSHQNDISIRPECVLGSRSVPGQEHIKYDNLLSKRQHT